MEPTFWWNYDLFRVSQSSRKLIEQAILEGTMNLTHNVKPKIVMNTFEVLYDVVVHKNGSHPGWVSISLFRCMECKLFLNQLKCWRCSQTSHQSHS